MREIAALLLAAFAPVWAFAGQNSEVVDVNPVHTNDPGFSKPEWKYEGVTLSVGFNCYADEGFLWWPVVFCHDPYLTLEKGAKEGAYVRINDDRLDSEDGWRRGFSTVMGVRLYKELAAANDQVLSLHIVDSMFNPTNMDREHTSYEKNIRLVDFEARVAEYMSAQEKKKYESLEYDKKFWLTCFFSWVLGGALALFLLFWLFRKASIIFSRSKDACFGVAKRFRKSAFDYKVRQAVVDEAVRQVTRQKISEVNEEGRELLIKRMQEALDRNDIDAAKEISLILNASSPGKA